MIRGIALMAAVAAILCGAAPVFTHSGGGKADHPGHSSQSSLPSRMMALFRHHGFEVRKEFSLTRGGSHQGYIFSAERRDCGVLAVPLDPPDEILQLVRHRIPEAVFSGALVWVGAETRPLPGSAWEIHLLQMTARLFGGAEASRAVLLVPDGKCGRVFVGSHGHGRERHVSRLLLQNDAVPRNLRRTVRLQNSAEEFIVSKIN
ncbi:hypothetical protein [Nisaea nitritireducens]|uniref:hypothetical protein n=1 Tax=Nisaea nitritireducens TaxID=568392 RepID=UPI0018667DBD|nr:hypothetical protein [Nisaea nitritireducens]